MPDPSDHLSDVQALLRERLGVKGRDLRDQVRRAGPRFPRRALREADILIRAETMARHPRFARLIDPREVARAERRLAHRLRQIDPLAKDRNRRCTRPAAAGLCLLAAFAVMVTLLRWRGVI